MKGCKQDLLTTALRVIRARRRQYGDPAAEFGKVAALWGAILDTRVEPRQVGLCMAAAKLVREAHQHRRDNLVDLCGYAACVAELYHKKGKHHA